MAAGLLAVSLLPNVGSAKSVTLVDATTRNGSFETGQLSPWQAVETPVKFTNAKPPLAADGKRYVAIENVASSGRGAAGYLINHRLPARERDGQHFELEYIAWSDGKDRFLSRSAYLVFKKGKDEVVKIEIIDQGPITTEPKTYRTVFSTSYSGWDSVDLRIILRRSGPSGTRGTGYLDGVTLRQTTEAPKPTAP
ncbi:MAG: hypothetical protein PCFJNLEI_01651 [Verrucomicrobiae bacterium]|nr:hypothetical protein [Verrucomicrobiae bacterium]